MSWIKENKFIVALGGGTLVGVIALYWVGSSGAARYEEAKSQFDAAAAEASGFERLALYPKIANRDGKRKALDEYRKATETLQSSFDRFRPKELKDISAQEFTDRLKTADAEIRKAFEESGTIVPEAFFVGFESYKTSLARANTTGILDYQLSSIKNVLLQLAKARPTELKNLHRPSLVEESGQPFTPPANAVVRPLPLEITFVGPERSAREFLSSIVKPENQFLVVRSVRITNTKKDPPRASDAQFDKPAAAKTTAPADVFGGGFVLPGDDAVPADAEKPAEVAAPAAAAPADSSRILAQVLGNEEVQVFVRLDLFQFLPAKKLP
jgi:hypothetical protein